MDKLLFKVVIGIGDIHRNTVQVINNPENEKGKAL